MEIEKIKKRSGEIESYNIDKIVRAVYKWLESVWNKNLNDAKKVAEKVNEYLEKECEEIWNKWYEKVQKEQLTKDNLAIMDALMGALSKQ